MFDEPVDLDLPQAMAEQEQCLVTGDCHCGMPQAEAPPDFRREVWRRISATAPEPGWIEKLAWWLLRPKREAFIVAKAGRKYAPQAMAMFRSLRIIAASQQSWPSSDVLQQYAE